MDEEEVARRQRLLEESMRRGETPGHDAYEHLHQQIRNSRPIPPRHRQVTAQPPIEVTAWIVWERDGLELLDTKATAWAGTDVLVHINDTAHRWRFSGVWLHAHDVRRR